MYKMFSAVMLILVLVLILILVLGGSVLVNITGLVPSCKEGKKIEESDT